jgi:uncharacterized Zn-binding protein involved in type VI secretion
MVTPGVPPTPHAGGPIAGPCTPNVLVGGLPAAAVGDLCTCVGPFDTIVTGSATVMINGRSAARVGDACAHGGSITLGLTTVMIGG